MYINACAQMKIVGNDFLEKINIIIGILSYLTKQNRSIKVHFYVLRKITNWKQTNGMCIDLWKIFKWLWKCYNFHDRWLILARGDNIGLKFKLIDFVQIFFELNLKF